MPSADPPAWLEARLRTVGDRTRDARIRANWTQEKLAEKAEVSRDVVQRLERGGNVTLAHLLRIARALRLSVTELFT